ncbi:MAG: glutamate--tRNA ligase [bacterium]|nr:glutamate--tRNA ligase [bacterium]MDA1024484.1 glutamate--tRNA ligase [bacterium]
MKRIRTRIAPSPTGYVHIGTLRTALFNYFFSRQHDGDFLIRIEDTDRERTVDGSIENLLDVLHQLGLENDEGPVLEKDGSITEKGDYGPYVQSERIEIYKEYALKLVAQGDAYYCFDAKEELDAMREAQRATKQRVKYDRRALKLSDEEVRAKLEAGEPYVIRMKVPEGETVVEDLIRGNITFNNEEVDDQILLKSDGYPTYHLAVVVDDSLMNITHVIRGEEWVPSTPKHVMLYKMLGFEAPVYAHVPLLLNPDKTKLSKRQGDVSVEDYLKKGYVKEALVNFVATLGFNPSGDREIFTIDELIDSFKLEKVNKAGAVLNKEKLDWMNNQYIRALDAEDFIERVEVFIGTRLDSEIMRRSLIIERSRIDRLDQVPELIEIYSADIDYDAAILVWKKGDSADAMMQLEGVKTFLEGQGENIFDSVESIEAAVKGYIAENNLQNGNVLWPLRISLSGREHSPSPFELLWALGKDEALKRIERAMGKL